MAQIVDTPARRAFMALLGEQGWLGITWPKEYGGKEGDGVYEHLLNEALARRADPRSARASASWARRSSATASEKMKQEFLPKILRQRGRVRRRLLRAQRRIGRGVHAVEGHPRRRRAGA